MSVSIYHQLCLLVLLLGLAVSSAYAEKIVLVLFPVQVGEADTDYGADFGSALQEGLQTRYKVFYGRPLRQNYRKNTKKSIVMQKNASKT